MVEGDWSHTHASECWYDWAPPVGRYGLKILDDCGEQVRRRQEDDSVMQSNSCSQCKGDGDSVVVSDDGNGADGHRSGESLRMIGVVGIQEEPLSVLATSV